LIYFEAKSGGKPLKGKRKKSGKKGNFFKKDFYQGRQTTKGKKEEIYAAKKLFRSTFFFLDFNRSQRHHSLKRPFKLTPN
jgi:hypothetical protein